MKTNIAGLVVTVIITFNLICMAVFFILRALKRGENRKFEEDGDSAPPN